MELPTDDRPVVLPPDQLTPPAPRKSHPITCEFCECSLAPNGDIISMGPRAKELRKADEKIEALQEQVNVLTRERDELATALRAAVPKKERGTFDFFGGD